MKTIKISNVPAGAQALAHDLCAGGVVDQMCAHGLVIGDKSLEFPDYLLNTLTWTVNWRWEIFDDDRDYLEPDERNEMNALKRLKDRLNKMGGVDQMELTDDGQWIDGFGPRATDSSDVETTSTDDAIRVSISKEVNDDVCRYAFTAERETALHWHRGGKIELTVDEAVVIVDLLTALIEHRKAITEAGVEIVSTKARFAYTLNALLKALDKKGNK